MEGLRANKAPKKAKKTLECSETNGCSPASSPRRKPRTIASLELGRVGGIVEGRVLDKGQIITFGKSNKLFSFSMADQTGMIFCEGLFRGNFSASFRWNER